MAEKPITFCIDNKCRPLHFENGYSAGSIVIGASVGIKGVNQTEDVRTIQQALNDVPESEGRPLPLLVTDGICGNKTKDAIQKFQLKHFGWKLADGRVDPYRQTIAKLNQLVRGSGYSIGTGSKENRIPRAVEMLNETLSLVRAARANLHAAIPVVNLSDFSSPFSVFSRAELMKKVNAHFRVDDYPVSQRSKILQQLLKIYERMLEVFSRRGGPWGTAIFELDPINQKNLAYTFGGGFFRGGRTSVINRTSLREDSIYLCDLLDRQGKDWFTSTVVHELAHFCGGITGTPEHIKDHAYGWYDYPKMKSLTPRQLLFNATSYSNFAFDAKHSRMPAIVNF